MQNWKELRSELLEDPAVSAEYERLEPEYRLARQLIEARMAKHLTQAELAEKAGVKQAFIARLESGSANPTYATLVRIANVLGVKLQLVSK